MSLHVNEPSAKYLVRQSPRAAAVGELPHDWTLVRLIEVAEVRGGVAKNANVAISDPIEVAYLRVANVQDGYLDLGDVSKIKINKVDLKRYSLLPGDVLMNEGGDLDKLGRGALWRGEIETCVHQNHVFSVRCKPQLLGEYLNVWTGSAGARRFFLLAGKQTTNLASISKSSLGEMPVFLPRLEEQRAIAAALSDIDALISGLEKLIAKKRDLKQAAMQQLLTGQTRLPGFSGAWSVKRLGDHFSILKNGVNSRAELSVEGGVAYLHYGDIHGSKSLFLNPHKTTMPTLPLAKAKDLDRLQSGDLVFADASEDLDGVGKSVEVQGSDVLDLVSGQHTIAIRFDKTVLADGFKAYLQFFPAFSAHLYKLAAGTKVYATNRSHIASAEIKLPEVDEQRAIASILQSMNAELSSIETRLSKVRQLKQGMMQELLTGRSRLI